MRAMSRGYVCAAARADDACTWLKVYAPYLCDTTRYYVCHDSLICMPWLMCASVVLRGLMMRVRDSKGMRHICVTWPGNMCAMTHMWVCVTARADDACVPWLIYVCHDSFIRWYHNADYQCHKYFTVSFPVVECVAVCVAMCVLQCVLQCVLHRVLQCVLQCACHDAEYTRPKHRTVMFFGYKTDNDVRIFLIIYFKCSVSGNIHIFIYVYVHMHIYRYDC